MATIHTVQRDLLITAWSDPQVAAAAQVSNPTWAARVLVGDRDGYIHQLHRGRLPAVELIMGGETWKQLGDVDMGTVKTPWLIRIHVGGFDQAAAEVLARAILYAGLIKTRAQNYFKIGDDVVSKFQGSPLGHMLEANITVENAMGRDTYETTPDTVNTPPTSSADVGGISTLVNYNDVSPKAVLTIPAGQAINGVQIAVLTPFNGASPSVTIGVNGNQSKYMAAADSDVTMGGASFEADADDVGPLTVNVYITPGAGCTQGQIEVQISTTNA
jgi:hypothetical protein